MDSSLQTENTLFNVWLAESTDVKPRDMEN